MMPNLKKYNHPNLINKKIMSKPKKKKKKKKEWEQKKHLTRLLKPRKANEKKKNKKRERTKIIWLLKLEFKKQKNKKNNMYWSPCATHGHFCASPIKFSPPSFLPILGKNLFLGPHHHFPLPFSRPNTL